MLHNLTRSIFRVILPGAVLGAFTSCYEDAVTEKLVIEFLRDGPVQVESVVEFLDSGGTANQALKQRVAALRAEYEREQDPWSRRFSGLYSLKDRYVREREEEDLFRVERVSQTTLSVLPRIFDDTNVTVSVIEGTGWREVAFYPATSTRASQQQRAFVNRSLDEWSRNVASYLRAEQRLYRYAADRPDRAAAVIGSVMKDFLSEEEAKKLEPDEEEEALIKNATDRMAPILASLSASENEAFSLDELSSLVFDPFPAELTVRVPGEILEFEGFEKAEENSLTVPKLRLWGALESLQDAWASPDLLVAYVSAARSGAGRFDLQEFLSRQRRVAEVPNDTSVRAAVEQRLARKPVYRVRWRT